MSYGFPKSPMIFQVFSHNFSRISYKFPRLSHEFLRISQDPMNFAGFPKNFPWISQKFPCFSPLEPGAAEVPWVMIVCPALKGWFTQAAAKMGCWSFGNLKRWPRLGRSKEDGDYFGLFQDYFLGSYETKNCFAIWCFFHITNNLHMDIGMCKIPL